MKSRLLLSWPALLTVVGLMTATYRTAKADDLVDVDTMTSLTDYAIHFGFCGDFSDYDAHLMKDFEQLLVGGGEEGNANRNGHNLFAVFRLCPNTQTFETTSSCQDSENHGDYIVSLNDYLHYVVAALLERQENDCHDCYTYCDETNVGQLDLAGKVDCSTCYDECQKIDEMEDYGYLDAASMAASNDGCLMVCDQKNGGCTSPLYAGPVCGNDGTKIKMGVFTDEHCLNLYDKDVEEYLVNDGYHYKLSHALLKQAYQPYHEPVMDCIDHTDASYKSANADNTNNVLRPVMESGYCRDLYDMAGKCETPYHFSPHKTRATNGGGGTDRDADDMKQQDEKKACTIIQAVLDPSSISSTAKAATAMSPPVVPTRPDMSALPTTPTSSSAIVVTEDQKYLLSFFGAAMVVVALVVVRLTFRVRVAQDKGLLPSSNKNVQGDQYELVQQQKHDLSPPSSLSLEEMEEEPDVEAY